MAFAYMKDTALESVMDIPITRPESIAELLDEYQNRFLHQSRSQILQAQFACIVQLPNGVSSEGNKYLLTLKDVFSKWLEAIPLTNTTSENIHTDMASLPP